MANDDERRREEEQAAGIKVTDRRAFTREGSRREPDAPPEASEPILGGAKGAPAGEPAQATRPAASESAERPDRGGARRDPEPEPEPAMAPAADGDQQSIDFVAFVQSLYVGALMALGEVENPYTRQFETNLDLARQNIDILVMLQEKTVGNLSREEAGFIEQVVPQLQLLFAKKAG